jgi:ribose 5-phosphate isomerase B
MKIGVVSDELYPVNKLVIDWLLKHGHEVITFGALKSGRDESWVKATIDASEAVNNNIVDEGIFFCWSGTGSSIVANRFDNIRAALCTDAETARAARIWNHANVLVLSNRLLSEDIAKETLNAWFDSYDKSKGQLQVNELKLLCSK